jgi:pimeloyl-ACP methyl ester carboxylesterase
MAGPEQDSEVRLGQDPQYRKVTAAVVVVIGLLATIALAATVMNTSPTQVSAPSALLGVPAFEGRYTTPSAFYEVPAESVAELNPGTLLRSETIAEAPEGINAQRFIYVSQTATGENQAVSGLYVNRAGPEPGPNGRPLVALAHGTTGNAPGCGVSIAPFTPGSTGYTTWDLIISGLVGAGFAVVATDYANLGVPGIPDYITMEGEGADVLNSVRAAYQLDRVGLDRSKTAIMGHSQGGHAALSAAYIAPDYAPELSLKGTIAMSPALFPPAPILGSFITQNPDDDASGFLSFLSYIVQSWSANFPDQVQPADIFTDKGVAASEAAQQTCLTETVELFKGPKKDFVKAELPDSIVQLAANNFPVYEAYTHPLLIQQGLADDVVVPGVNIAAARTFCEQGSEVNLQTFPADQHSTVLLTGKADATRWLQDRFNSVPVRSDCEAM